MKVVKVNFTTMTIQERNEAIFECHKQGLNQVLIGKIFKRSQSTISKVIRLVKSGRNVTKAETRGSKPYLTNSEKEVLKKTLEQSPADFGYTVWDKWSIKEIIFKKFAVRYHENSISRIMKCIKFSSQKPQRKDYRQDADKVRKFKSEQIPKFKKSAGRKSTDCLSRRNSCTLDA